MKRWLCLLILIFGLHSGMHCAARFDIVNYDRQSDYLDGTLNGIQLDPDGRLTLAREFTELWCSETDSSCWTLAADNGTTYVATGNDGNIYRLRNNSSELFFDAPQVAIFSLLPFDNRSLLAGSAPDGIVYQIDKSGNGSVFCRTDAHYIWDMLEETDGNILLATGLPASIVRVTPHGEILETIPLTAEHARTMSQSPNGDIWIGTASTGRIYRLKGSDIQLVHDTFSAEISCLVSDEEGVWFATVAAPAIKGSSSDRPEDLKPRKRLQNELNEHGTVYFMDYEFRSVQEMLEVKSAPIFDMEIMSEGPVIACGNSGYLIHLNDTRRATVLANMGEQSIIALTTDKSGNLLAGTGGPACVFMFSEQQIHQGSYESIPVDAGNHCRWGRIYSFGSATDGQNAQFSTRTGNTEEPDAEWSKWQSASDDGAINSPPGRYLQWSLTLNPDKRNRIPVIDTVSISMKTANKAPYIEEVRVYPVTQGQLVDTPSRGKSYRQMLPDGMRIEYILPANGGTRGVSRGTWMKLRGMRTISWTAGDQDTDRLLYSIQLAAVQQNPRWLNLAENITDPVFSFDSSVFPDGRYMVRVTVDDSLSHPVGDFETFSLVSRVFEIDNTPPALENLSAGITQTQHSWILNISGTAVDKTSSIRALEYSLDAEKWYNFTSSDSMLDAPEEAFKLTLEEDTGKKKPSMVFLKVSDAQENSTTSTVNVE